VVGYFFLLGTFLTIPQASWSWTGLSSTLSASSVQTSLPIPCAVFWHFR